MLVDRDAVARPDARPEAAPRGRDASRVDAVDAVDAEDAPANWMEAVRDAVAEGEADAEATRILGEVRTAPLEDYATPTPARALAPVERLAVPCGDAAASPANRMDEVNAAVLLDDATPWATSAAGRDRTALLEDAPAPEAASRIVVDRLAVLVGEAEPAAWRAAACPGTVRSA